MKQQLKVAFWMTIVTTILFGLVYPLVVTGLAQLIFPRQANGELIRRDGKVAGSQLLGQAFTSPGYFHSRPSSAGNGYEGLSSGGSNLGPTNHQLTERIKEDLRKLQRENPNAPVPVDLVTSSASGLDPDITPAAAEFQIPRVARERGMTEAQLRELVLKHTKSRQWGFLGEPRVNVLELNLELDSAHALHYSAAAPPRGLASSGPSNR